MAATSSACRLVWAAVAFSEDSGLTEESWLAEDSWFCSVGSSKEGVVGVSMISNIGVSVVTVAGVGAGLFLEVNASAL